MGMFQKLGKGLGANPDPRIEDGIQGEVLVTDADSEGLIRRGVFTTSSGSGHSWLGELSGVVRVPGRPPYEASITHWMSRQSYPLPGMVIPATIDRSDSNKILLDVSGMAEIDQLIANGDPLFTDPGSVQQKLHAAISECREKVTQNTAARVAEAGAQMSGVASEQILGALTAAGFGSPGTRAPQPPRPPVPTDHPTARIVSLMPDWSDPNDPTQQGSWRVELLLSVNLPGSQRYGARYHGRAHGDRSYQLWDDVPVEVDGSDPAKVKIRWAELNDVGHAIADRLEQAGTAMQERMEQAQAMQASALASAHSAPGQVPQAAAQTANPIDLIARLATLHESGALTDEEFAAEKARLLAEI